MYNYNKAFIKIFCYTNTITYIIPQTLMLNEKYSILFFCYLKQLICRYYITKQKCFCIYIDIYLNMLVSKFIDTIFIIIF